MQSRSELAGELAAALCDLDQERVCEALELSTDELLQVRGGVDALPDPVRAACQIVLDDWDQLDAHGRFAALLALANALAGAP